MRAFGADVFQGVTQSTPLSSLLLRHPSFFLHLFPRPFWSLRMCHTRLGEVQPLPPRPFSRHSSRAVTIIETVNQ
ncbi:hypothetical protein BV25DRAFT_425597 [Artomyces pyxidatus]|uniref:Uncharacterized protein n=1 Tax=Artomyces pyxidatus TaxID=48021 RepID=A0ACB8T4L3_9AGAM|nr:hypothetical protein BV25DRAFT_425597 [Artomyces pyxidatus]